MCVCVCVCQKHAPRARCCPRIRSYMPTRAGAKQTYAEGRRQYYVECIRQDLIDRRSFQPLFERSDQTKRRANLSTKIVFSHTHAYMYTYAHIYIHVYIHTHTYKT
jgi:hypothetical protein